MEIVTGIVPSEADANGVERALEAAGLSLDPLQVFSGDDDGIVGGELAQPHDDSLLGNTGTGTGVPGLTSPGQPVLQSRAFVRNDRLIARLDALEIPDDEVDNYVDALEAGRAIVAYFANPDETARVTEIFTASGLARVRTF